MKIAFRISILCLIFWFGHKSILHELGGYVIGPLGMLKYVPFALLIMLTVGSVLLDACFYKIHKVLFQFYPGFVGVIFCSIVFYKITQRKSMDHAKTILKISNKAEPKNVLLFEFKDNGHFRLIEFKLLSQTSYYGRYSKENDTITITECNYNGDIKNLPHTGIIKDDTMFWNKFDTMLLDRR